MCASVLNSNDNVFTCFTLKYCAHKPTWTSEKDSHENCELACDYMA